MDFASQIPDMITNAGRELVRRLTATSNTPLLPFVPKWIKVIFLFLMVCQAPSWPFLWHLRVWYYPLRAYYLAYTKGHMAYWKNWRKEYVEAGGLKDMRVKVWRRALLDDCDYNMHLSNSCYAKNSDAAKMKFCIDSFAPCFVTGLHMALGASHWKYMKEIPMGSQYLMETRVGSWGDKWIHVVTEFVIFPKGGKRKGGKKAPVSEKEQIIPNLSLPPSGTDTPSSSATSAKGHTVPQTPEEVVRRLTAATRSAKPRADGGVVACIAVTDYCFKQGRITIPPRIAFYLSLLSENPDNRAAALKILNSKDKGAAFAKGGWKDAVDADQIGRDVGLGPDGTQDWANEGRFAMQAVDENLALF